MYFCIFFPVYKWHIQILIGLLQLFSTELPAAKIIKSLMTCKKNDFQSHWDSVHMTSSYYFF